MYDHETQCKTSPWLGEHGAERHITSLSCTSTRAGRRRHPLPIHHSYTQFARKARFLSDRQQKLLWQRVIQALTHSLSWVVTAGRSVTTKLIHTYQRQNMMRQLAALDDHLLKDIGLSRCQLSAVVAEHFDSDVG